MDFVEVSIRFNPSSPLRVWFSLVKFILEICSGNPKHLIGLDFDSLRGCPLSPWVTLIQSSCISILTLVICVAFPLSPHVGLIVLQKKRGPVFPPTPADSRGSASEKRGQEAQEARGRTAMVFWPCGRVLWPELRRTKASCNRTQASWKQETRCLDQTSARRRPAASTSKQVGS